MSDSPLAHLPPQHPGRARRQAWREGEDGFCFQFPPSWSSECWRPPRMFAGCSLGHTTVREKPLLSPGVLSTEVPPPGSNRKGGELCEGDPLVGRVMLLYF